MNVSISPVRRIEHAIRPAPEAHQFPRLLYLSAVPPEKSFHGSVLLYRLLENYPPDKLMVIESNFFPSVADRRLPGVRYKTLLEGWPRPLYTRFSRIYRTWLTRTAASRAGKVESLLEGFVPQAVLTVTHFVSWITAAYYAAQNRLPLHLILHDECVEIPSLAGWSKAWLRRIFGNIYRKAQSRLCVSPYMVDEYEARYGSAGDVLYPSRAKDAQDFGQLPQRLLQSNGNEQLVVAFGGTVNSAGVIQLLGLIARALEPMKGVLKLFGPIDPDRARTNGLAAANIEFRGSLNADAFKLALREEADVLLAPMNFAPEDAANARTSFPSKLAEYTAVGLPILIVGPEYCSGVRWARDHAPVAEVVSKADVEEIARALNTLRLPERRRELARAALEKGDKFFGHAIGETALFHHLGVKAS